MPVLTKRSGKRTHAAPAPTPIKPIREWFGLSQEACARALGVGRATIARWEARRTGPDPNTAEGRLLAALTEARDLAIKQFGPQQAHQWLDHRAPTFHGDTPRETLVKRGPIPVRDVLLAGWEGAYV